MTQHAPVWLLASVHRPEQDAKRVGIHAAGDLAVADQCLGGNVAGCATRVEGERALLVILHPVKY